MAVGWYRGTDAGGWGRFGGDAGAPSPRPSQREGKERSRRPRCAAASRQLQAPRNGRLCPWLLVVRVNPGAEVIADGHIHVYAPLRGKAIAGARGDTDARILTLCLEPELVSIAGVYRTSENPLPKSLKGKPAQVRLMDDKLVMEPLKT